MDSFTNKQAQNSLLGTTSPFLGGVCSFWPPTHGIPHQTTAFGWATESAPGDVRKDRGIASFGLAQYGVHFPISWGGRGVHQLTFFFHVHYGLRFSFTCHFLGEGGGGGSVSSANSQALRCPVASDLETNGQHLPYIQQVVCGTWQSNSFSRLRMEKPQLPTIHARHLKPGNYFGECV